MQQNTESLNAILQLLKNKPELFCDMTSVNRLQRDEEGFIKVDEELLNKWDTCKFVLYPYPGKCSIYIISDDSYQAFYYGPTQIGEITLCNLSRNSGSIFENDLKSNQNLYIDLFNYSSGDNVKDVNLTLLAFMLGKFTVNIGFAGFNGEKVEYTNAKIIEDPNNPLLVKVCFYNTHIDIENKKIYKYTLELFRTILEYNLYDPEAEWTIYQNMESIPLSDEVDLSDYYTINEINSKLNNKADKTQLSDYATHSYVLAEIAKAQLEGEEIDLSGYATKDDLKDKADKTELFSKNYDDLTNKPTIPSKVSQLINDSGYLVSSDISGKADKTQLSNYYTKNEVDKKNYVNIQQVENKINQIITDAVSGDTLTNLTDIVEYINEHGGEATEMVSAISSLQTNKADKTDLNSYAKKTELFSKNYNDLTNKPTIPTEVSQLTNDSGYLVSSDISGKADKTELFSKNYNDLTNKPIIPSKVSQLTNDSGYLVSSDISGKADSSTVYTKTEIDNKLSSKANNSDLSNKQDKLVSGTNIKTVNNTSILGSGNIAISVPTKVSQLTNDSGYLVSSDISGKADSSTVYTKTEIDNKLSSKANTATTYTKEEVNTELSKKLDYNAYEDFTDYAEQTYATKIGVGAELSSYAKKTELFSKNYNDLTNKPTIPSKVSQLTNDSGYLTEHQDISGKADKTELFSKNYNDLTNKPTIPTKVSQLANDSGYLTEHQDISGKADKTQLSNYYTKNEVDEKKYVNIQQVENKINQIITDAVSGDTLTNLTDIVEYINEHGGEATEMASAISSLQTNKADKTDLNSYAKKTELFSKNYNDLTNKPTIPTKVSQLTNDKGYLTSHQDISGKQDKLVSGTNIKTVNNTSILGSGNIAINVPTKVSQLTNDSGYLTSHQDISGKQDKLVSGTNIKTVNNISILGSGNIAISVPTKVSQLTNDKGYLVSSDISGKADSSTVYTKTQADNVFATKNNTYTKTEVDNKIANAISSGAYVYEPITSEITLEAVDNIDCKPLYIKIEGTINDGDKIQLGTFYGEYDIFLWDDNRVDVASVMDSRQATTIETGILEIKFDALMAGGTIQPNWSNQAYFVERIEEEPKVPLGKDYGYTASLEREDVEIDVNKVYALNASKWDYQARSNFILTDNGKPLELDKVYTLKVLNFFMPQYTNEDYIDIAALFRMKLESGLTDDGTGEGRTFAYSSENAEVLDVGNCYLKLGFDICGVVEITFWTDDTASCYVLLSPFATTEW